MKHKSRQKILVAVVLLTFLAGAVSLLPAGVTPLLNIRPYQFYFIKTPARLMQVWGELVPVPGQICLVRTVDLTRSSRSILILTPKGWRRSVTGPSFTIGQ